MANQVIVTNTGNVQVALTPPPNVQVQISRAAIGTVSNVPTANFANYAGNVTSSNQPNITTVGTLGNLIVSGNTTVNNLTVTGNLVANVTVNTANYANFANIANIANSVAVANVSGIGNIATINLDGNAGNILYGNGSFAAVPNVANVANANYANFAGTAFNVSGSNVNGAVNLANFATTANAIAGANVSGTVANANFASYSEQANNANLSTFATTANAVAGANVSGQVANALVAGTVYTNAQPNITSVGNLTSLTSTGNITAPYFIGNVVGNISGNLVVPGTNTSVLFNQQGNAGASDAFQFNYATNVATITGNLSATNISGNGSGLSNIAGANITGVVANANYSAYAGQANTANLATFATTANAVAGANVSGEVANANYSAYANIAATANSVAVANVSGIGNIATVNLDGNASNILFGNGTFSAIPVVSNVANANYANFAGTAYSVSGANVSGEVANANYATYSGTAGTANSVAGANVSGTVANANFASYSNIASTANSVAVANVSGIGNIATTNYDGNASNILYGNGGFYALPTISNVANANFAAYAGNVTVNAQPNITSVGTLSSLSVTGNIQGGNILSSTFQAVNSAGGALKNVSGASQLQWGAGGGNNVTVDVSININPANGQVDISPTGNGGHVHIKPTGNNAVEIAPTTAGVINNMIIGNVTPQAANVTTLGASGNITGANANLGNLVVANFFSGNGSLLTGISVSNVANANYANFAGQVVDATQSNITAVGTLGNLSVSGTISTANISDVGYIKGPAVANTNINLQPNIGGNVLINGPVGTANLVVTGNIDGQNANLGNLVTANFFSGNGSLLTGINGANVSNVANANYANFAGTAYSVSGANVSGEVANANYASYANIANTANSVAVGNVSGIGNIATINLDGSSSNVLYGNGVFAPESTSIANANYANFAGTVVNATQSNITTVGNLTALTINDSLANTKSPTLQFIPNGSNGGFFNFPTTYMVYNDYGSQNSNANPMNFTFVKYRGNSVSPLPAANADQTMRISSQVYNGNTTPRNVLITAAAPSAANSTFTGANVSWSPGQLNFITGNPNGNVANSASTNSQNGLQWDQQGRLNITQATYGAAYGILVTNYGSNSDGSGGSGGAIQFNRQRGNREGHVAVVNGDTIGGALFTAYNGTTAGNAGSILANVDTTFGTISNGGGIPTTITISPRSNTTNFNFTFAGDGNLTLPTNTSSINYANGSPYGGGANANYANFAGTVVGATQSNITQTGNLVSLTINNGVAGSTTKQFAPNGVTIISTANTNLMSNSSFVDIDYGNGQGDGNVLLGKSQTYLKTRGNASSQTTANVSDRVGRTNYSFYNGTNNVLAAATQVNPFGTFNANANAVTTSGQYVIITGNPNGDQGNANALSNQNIYTFDPYGRIGIQQGAAGTTSSALNINSYGGSGGNGASATQGIVFQRLRGNRDGNLSVQPNDQLGAMIFSGFNGTSQFATRTATVRAVVDSTYTANSANIPAGLQFVTCDNTTTYTTTFSASGQASFPGGATFVMNNISTVIPSFAFSTYNNSNSLVNPYTFFRARGNSTTPAAAQVNDVVSSVGYNIYADAGNTYSSVASTTVTVSDNDGAGNVAATYNITAKTISLTGNVTANNVSISSSTGFMKLSTYTAAALTAITGSVGWMAAVTNSTPGGMLAYWDTTNTRWSYVHDNSAV